jgi:hypothetical protein
MEKTHNNQSREPATKGDLQAAVSDLRGMMTDMMEELTATHEDVRYLRIVPRRSAPSQRPISWPTMAQPYEDGGTAPSSLDAPW